MEDAAPVAPPERIDLGELERSLGFLLRIAQLRNFEDFYADVAGQSLKPGEFTVLALIGRNPGVRQGRLARHLMIKRAHMTKLVRGFVERGLVTRDGSDRDRRSVELRLTAAGERFVARHAPAFEAHARKRPETLTADEHAALVGLLRRYIGLRESP